MQAEQFTRVARTYMDTVYRVALNYMKSPDAADDITQEVFLRLLRSQTEFASEEHIRHWLIRVTINECKRDLASRWRRVEPLEAYAEKLSFSSEENSETYRSVMRLPRKYRMVIYLHYYEGYSTAEIAQLLGSKQSTVCTQLERGRKLLKNMLSEANDDEN
jgi:RNA polymerase sigma-70 factor (ECF subfamily)